MSLGRSRIIAAQAVVVGVLMVVVFLTLLRPDADNQLFSIETPGETEIAQPRDRQLREDAGGPDRRDSRRGNRDARPGGVLGAGAGGASAGPGGGQPLSPGTDSLAPGTPGGAGDEGPADDQYADSVARLTARLY